MRCIALAALLLVTGPALAQPTPSTQPAEAAPPAQPAAPPAQPATGPAQPAQAPQPAQPAPSTQATPSDTDLQSAYCIRVVITQVQFMTDSLERTKESDPLYDATEQMLRQRREDLRRLQGYLAPKLSWLDMDSLVKAGKRAETDLWENGGLASQCLQQCGPETIDGQPAPQWDACIERCTDTPLTQRLASCRRLDWLPQRSD